METTVGQFLTTIQNPSVIIIDCVRNMDAAQIAANGPPLVQQLRQLHPTTPIVLAEGTAIGMEWDVADQMADSIQQNIALTGVYQARVSAGDKNVYYVTRGQLFSAPNQLDSPTARGLHPSDDGMKDVGDFYAAFLPTIMG